MRNRKTKSQKVTVILGTLAVFFWAASACAPSEAPLLDQVAVQLKWHHQAQFAGFYAADQNGYYQDQGLSVTFLPGGSGIDSISPILNGTADFGIAGADDLIVARSEGHPFTAIAVVYRRNPLVYFSLVESGITTPRDFAGKSIRLNTGQRSVFEAMMAHVGVTADQYTLVCCEIEPFLAGDVDVSSGYLTNEVLAVEQAGHDLNIIYADDYGVHFYADTIAVNEKLAASNPDLVRRFLNATLKGWRWAIENPEAAGVLALDYDPGLDAEGQIAQMVAEIPLVHTGEDQIGWMRPEAWQGMMDLLLNQGILTEPVDLGKVYTMRFLQEIYVENGR